jgi:hypothetical protein
MTLFVVDWECRGVCAASGRFVAGVARGVNYGVVDRVSSLRTCLALAQGRVFFSFSLACTTLLPSSFARVWSQRQGQGNFVARREVKKEMMEKTFAVGLALLMVMAVMSMTLFSHPVEALQERAIAQACVPWQGSPATAGKCDYIIPKVVPPSTPNNVLLMYDPKLFPSPTRDRVSPPSAILSAFVLCLLRSLPPSRFTLCVGDQHRCLVLSSSASRNCAIFVLTSLMSPASRAVIQRPVLRSHRQSRRQQGILFYYLISN